MYTCCPLLRQSCGALSHFLYLEFQLPSPRLIFVSMQLSCRINIVAIVLALGTMSQSSRADVASDYRDKVRPLLEQHCFECHNEKKKKGDLNLAEFVTGQQFVDDTDLSKELAERLQAYEMPPKGSPEMDDAHRQTILDWFGALPKVDKGDCNEIASDRTISYYRGYVMSRRLNRAEYNNTVRDLFGVNLHLEELLPSDGSGGEGFDTAGSALFTSAIHIEKYLAAAEKALNSVVTDSSWGLSSELKKARERILVAKPSRSLPPREAARKIVGAFARRAFRRPVTSEESERLLKMFDRGQSRGDGFVASVRLSLQAILISPHFLFLAEPEHPGGGVHKLEPFPLASKLSYFLWSSMPDEELFAAAESGDLHNDRLLRKQVRRMLLDPKAAALGERFALQWLALDKLGTEVRPDPKKYPEFDVELNKAMLAEASALFNYIIHENRPLLELIDSDYTFMNQRLAKIYGIKGLSGATLQKVALNDKNRGGIVGMPGVHALTSYPLRTSPVLRGRWVLESLLGDKVPPPPPDVPALDEAPEKTSPTSLRAQLEKHRTKSECSACHNRMDPLGFGLENFDALGRWRNSDHGEPIDAKGTLPSGQTYVGPVGLKKVLMERKESVIRHLTRKMTGYAFGRELTRYDECVVNKAMEALQKNEYRSNILIEEIAMSAPFRQRFTPKQN